MVSKLRTTSFVAVVGLSGLLLGCAGFSSSRVSTISKTVQQSHLALQAPPAAQKGLLAPLIDSVGGVDLYPPPAGVSPRVTETDARTALVKITGPLPSNFAPKLAVLTDTESAVKSGATYDTLYNNRLVWAFIGQGRWSQSASHLGALGLNGSVVTPQFPNGTICTGVWVVDATSGAYLEGYSYCPSGTTKAP